MFNIRELVQRLVTGHPSYLKLVETLVAKTGWKI